MASSLLIPLSLVLSLSSTSTAHSTPDAAVLKAADTLSGHGRLSMALTLQLISQTIFSNSHAATIFAPSDAAFLLSGQPSLHQLQYQISPRRLSVKALKSLPHGTALPTLLPNHSLIITTFPSSGQLSINGVEVNESPIYDDHLSLIIYGLDNFFNSSFQVPPNFTAPAPSLKKPAVPVVSRRQPFDQYTGAADFLRYRGYSKTASFLDMQLVGFVDDTKLTVFAPFDEYVKDDFSDWARFFRRHVLRARLTWKDLARVDEGTVLKTFFEGFTVKVGRSGDVVEVNGVPVVFPDMYYSDWLIVHGLEQSLASRPKEGHIGESFSELGGDVDQSPPGSEGDF